MTRALSAPLLLIALASLPGCVREISEAQCPCLSGWECCEDQNVCRLEGTCEPSADVYQDGGSGFGRGDASRATWDAAAISLCDGGPGAGAYMCPAGPHAFASLDTFMATREALVGRWLVCEGTGFRWGPEQTRGIEFTADGAFHLLGEDANGALQRLPGIHSTGIYKGDSDNRDLNVYFNFPEGGGASFYPAFTANKQFLLAGGDSGFDSIYVRIESADGLVPASVPRTCGAGPIDAGQSTWDAAAMSLCDGGPGAPAYMCPAGPHAFAALDTFIATREALVGSWLVCEGTGFRWGPKQARGIEFTADGAFHLLAEDASGALQRVVGVRSTGIYKGSTHDSDLNVYFNFPEGGGASFYPAFTANKQLLLAGGDSGFDSIYVRIESADGRVPAFVPRACGAVVVDRGPSPASP